MANTLKGDRALREKKIHVVDEVSEKKGGKKASMGKGPGRTRKGTPSLRQGKIKKRTEKSKTEV